MSSLLSGLTSLRSIFSQSILVRHFNKYKTKNVKRLGPRPSKKLIAQNESIRSRGFLRSIRAYDPSSDAAKEVETICAQVGISTKPDTQLDDPVARFNVLKECFTRFNHAVPNSQLHTMETVGDVVKFYETSVVTTTPLESLLNMDLPKNLHIQQNYVRFHPETDTMFGGITAFPHSSSLVTGLKNKKKYPGFTYEPPWKRIAKKV